MGLPVFGNRDSMFPLLQSTGKGYKRSIARLSLEEIKTFGR